jgi:toxin ParE1/3/4
MTGYRVQRNASHGLDEIYVYTRNRWGEAQAERYILGMFDQFDAIVARDFPWRPVPAEFGVSGFVGKYEHHFVYWKLLANETVGIVTILHERMHQIERFTDDLK